MTALPEFFERAYHAVPEALGKQGISMAAAPLGIYYDALTDSCGRLMA